ncbi:MAG: hypothetical protein JKX83_01990 [Pseudomonadales bacterium]|nr:hypothetical protein [Pseudomonadales bacterium]
MYFLASLVGCVDPAIKKNNPDHDAELVVLFNFPKHRGRLQFKFEAINNGEMVDIENVTLRTNKMEEHTRTIHFKKPENLEELKNTLLTKSSTRLKVYSCLYHIPIVDSSGYYCNYLVGHDDKGHNGRCW